MRFLSELKNQPDVPKHQPLSVQRSSPANARSTTLARWVPLRRRQSSGAQRHAIQPPVRLRCDVFGRVHPPVCVTQAWPGELTNMRVRQLHWFIR